MQVAKVTVAEGAREAVGAPDRPRLAIAGPIVAAAGRVLTRMCGQTVRKGLVHRLRSSRASGEVSAPC